MFKTGGKDKDVYKRQVVGVVRNFCYQQPTSIPGCIALQQPQAENYLLFRASILFKFEEGSWHECRKDVYKRQAICRVLTNVLIIIIVW